MGRGPGTTASQGFWSVGSHFSMTFIPSPLFVTSNASRALSRGKRCVTKGLMLIRLDASKEMATGHLQGKQQEVRTWSLKERAKRDLASLQ